MSPVLEIKFGLPVELKKEGRWFISSCPILDVHSQGLSESKAKENLAEALSMFVHSCFERGTLDAVLRECGFTSLAQKPRKGSKTGDMIEIPLWLGASNHAPANAH